MMHGVNIMSDSAMKTVGEFRKIHTRHMNIMLNPQIIIVVRPAKT